MGYTGYRYKSDHETTGLRATTSMRNIIPSKDKRIDQCFTLLGREIPIDVMSENLNTRKIATINRLFPYYAEAVYRGGTDDQYEFKYGLSIADLVTKGLLSFDKGYPEVIA